MTKNERENYIFNSIMSKYNNDGSNIEKAKQEDQEMQASNINDILNISFDLYMSCGNSVQQEISNILCEYFCEMLPLNEKLALNNYIGYFDSGMGEYTFIALDISKFEDFLKDTSYSGITDILENNKLEIHSKSGFPEYFVLDQYQDILAFYDMENISDYMNSLMPGTIDCLLERYDYDENMTLNEYFSKILNEALNEPLMQW